MSLFKKGVKTGAKMLDEALTPSELKKKQAAQRRRTSKKLKEKEDPLKSFAGSKDKAIKKARQEAIDKAREKAKRTRGAQKKRQQKEKEAAVSKRKKQIGAGAAVATGVGTGVALSRGNGKSKTMKTTSQMKKDQKAIDNIAKRSVKKKTDLGTMGMGLTKIGEIKKPKLQRDKKADEAFRKARKAARGTVTGTGGRNVGVGENVRANVTREQLKDSGMNLNQYLNFMDKNDGKRPPKVATKRMGGMMTSKMASKGGKMGGKMAPGMMGGGMANKKPVPESNKGLKKLPKDVRNKMGYMKNGGMAKKGYSKGGAVKSAKKKRSTGAALRGFGAEIR